MRRNIKAAIGLVTAAAVLALPLPLWLGYQELKSSDFNGIQDLPLPGGADLGGHPVTITAEFKDVLSLVPQSSVKVNDVAVGRVTRIRLADDGWTARVTMKVNGDVRLPANSYARIEQSSLLGEKYVQLIAPPKGAQATVASVRDGVDIPLTRTNRNPEVEEVFGALSMLLNGGGIQQLRTITRELNKALGGNEAEIRSMVKRVTTFTKSLDDNKGDITDALDGVNALATKLSSRKTRIEATLDGLSPGLKVLHKQRGSLMTMLKSLDKLSGTAVETVNKSKEDMVADLKALGKILKHLADAGGTLPASLEVLVTYPFTDAVLSGVKGDYLNVYLKMTAAAGTQIIPAVPEAQPKQPLPLPSVGGDNR